MNFTRESIFISALRTFFNTFAVIIGLGLGIFLVALGIGTLVNTINMPQKAELTVSADANGNRKLLADTTPVLLRMNLHGIIGAKELSEETFSNMLISTRETPLDKDRVKGILLHVNTPGGLATTSASIYHMLKSYKEKYNVPILAYVDGLCASGGMYIAAAADQIYATSESIIGSVGVRLGPAFNFSGLMEKAGVQSLTLTEGKDKDMLNSFRPWKEGEDASLKAILAAQYGQFVDVVTSNRKKLDKEKLVNEYGAQVFIAPKAEELGYIDTANVSYTEALKALAQAANIEGDYQVIQIKPTQSIFQELAHSNSALLRGKIEHVFPLGPNMTSDMSGKMLFLYQP